MKKTIKIADYDTQRGIKACVEGNAAKLDGITNFLESGGVLNNPDCGLEAIKTGLNDAKKLVSDGKAKVAGAIAAKGIPTAADSAFDTLAANIGRIVTLSGGTADATAGAGQVLSGYTAYAKGSKVTGSIPSLGTQTVTPGTTDKAIPSGYYLSGQQTIAGDANLIPANIAEGKSIFGVTGSYGGKVKSGSLEGEIYYSSESVGPPFVRVKPGTDIAAGNVKLFVVYNSYAHSGSYYIGIAQLDYTGNSVKASVVKRKGKYMSEKTETLGITYNNGVIHFTGGEGMSCESNDIAKDCFHYWAI